MNLKKILDTIFRGYNMTFDMFIFGFIGGIAPEIVRIHNILKGGGFVNLQKPFLYVIFSIILAILVGILAVAFNYPNPINPINALWIGASTPLIINTLAKKAYPLPEP